MSKRINLEQAVLEIDTAAAEAIERGSGKVVASPFFFITGAGVSFPSVPLAGGIIKECKERARTFGHDPDQPLVDKSTMDEYSHWFELAYPHPRQRQEYLRGLIEPKPITEANLRLAHMLYLRNFSHLVLTTNFDDYTTKALRLLGERPILCDHPATAARIDPERDDIQVVHVHGSHLFYDCANLRGEIAEVHKQKETLDYGMPGLIENLLWRRSPLILGYSGWDGDVITSALKRRLGQSYPPGHSIYWFCFNHSSAEDLEKRDWIRHSEHIRLVVPTDAAPNSSITSNGTTASGRATNVSGESRLEAATVLNRLFELQMKRLPVTHERRRLDVFENPAQHFANYLELTFGGSKVEFAGYKLEEAIAQLRRSRATATAMVTRGSDNGTGKARRAVSVVSTPLDVDLSRLRKQLRDLEHESVVKACAKHLRSQGLAAGLRRDLIDIARDAGNQTLKRKMPDALKNDLIYVMNHDPALEASLGMAIPAHTTLMMACGSGQNCYAKEQEGVLRGLFTWELEKVLRAQATKTTGLPMKILHERIANQLLEHGKGTPMLPVLLGDADGLPSTSSGKLFAIVVGVGRFKDSKSDHLGIPGSREDADAIGALFSQTGFNGFAADGGAATKLTNERGTLAKITNQFQSLARKAGPKDCLLFYFAGHGTFDTPFDKPEYRLYPHDYVPDSSMSHRNRFLVLRELVEIANASSAGQRLFLLDTGCNDLMA